MWQIGSYKEVLRVHAVRKEADVVVGGAEEARMMESQLYDALFSDQEEGPPERQTAAVASSLLTRGPRPLPLCARFQ